MEKLLYQENRLMRCLTDEIVDAAVYQAVNQILDWVFLGMGFSRNVNAMGGLDVIRPLIFSENTMPKKT